MKNNNGFISMTLVYTMLVLFLFLMVSILTAYTIKNSYLNTIDEKIKNEIIIDGEPLNSTVTSLWFNECTSYPNSLRCKIASGAKYHANYDSGKSVNYNLIHSDSGVFYLNTNNNIQRIYFYRGAVSNNNVIYSGKCWKIIRTNEDGSVRMVYNGEPVSNTCTQALNASLTSVYNDYNNSNAYVGMMFNEDGISYELTHTNTNNSRILTNLYNWYSSLSDKSKIVDSIYCNDRSIKDALGNGSGSTPTNYGGKTRLSASGTVVPDYKCNMLNRSIYGILNTTYNDSFGTLGNGNEKLDYPIGLLTADDVVYAGGKYGTANTSYYLYVASKSYWTMTPYFYSSGAYIFTVANGQLSFSQTTSSSIYYMPVISIMGNVTVSGAGSPSSPYVVGA